MRLLTNEEIYELRQHFVRFGSNVAMERFDALVADRNDLAQQLAAARETIRRWERLAKCVREEGVFYVNKEWRISYGWKERYGWFAWNTSQRRHGPFDSEIDALAAIERWEAEQKGGDA